MPNKKINMIRLERNYAKVLRLVRNIRPEDRISIVELRNTLKLNVDY